MVLDLFWTVFFWVLPVGSSSLCGPRALRAARHGVPRDRAVAQHWFAEAAKRGDGAAHANLGLMSAAGVRSKP